MRHIVLAFTVLSAQAASADGTWNYLTDMSAFVTNFAYEDPAGDGRFLIDVDGGAYVRGVAAYSDPTPRGDGLWESTLLSYDVVAAAVSGRYHFTSTGTHGTTILYPDQSAPNPWITGAGQITGYALDDILLETPFYTAPTASRQGLSFALWNAPDYRDPLAVPLVPVVENTLQVLGLPSVSGILANALRSPQLPSDWTGLTYNAAASPGSIVLSAQTLRTAFFAPLNPAGILGAVDNGDDTYTIPTQSLDGFVAFTRDGMPGFVSAAPVGAIDNPMLPVTPPPDVIPTPIGEVLGAAPGAPFFFDFINASPSNITFIDPEVATGYVYESLGAASFTGVQLPTVGDGLFDLFLYDEVAQSYVDTGTDITAGEYFAFGDALRRFMINGIEIAAGLDPNNPTAFITGLTFDQAGSISVLQTPLVTSVPLPQAFSMMLAALACIGLKRRRVAHT